MKIDCSNDELSTGEDVLQKETTETNQEEEPIVRDVLTITASGQTLLMILMSQVW